MNIPIHVDAINAHEHLGSKCDITTVASSATLAVVFIKPTSFIYLLPSTTVH